MEHIWNMSRWAVTNLTKLNGLKNVMQELTHWTLRDVVVFWKIQSSNTCGVFSFWTLYCENTLRRMPRHYFDNKPTVVQAMAWHRVPRYMSSYGVIRPKWNKLTILLATIRRHEETVSNKYDSSYTIYVSPFKYFHIIYTMIINLCSAWIERLIMITKTFFILLHD